MDENGAISEPTEWYLTYCPKDFKSTREVDTPKNLLELLKADCSKKGIGIANVGLVMPSTFHIMPEIHQKLPVGAEMMMYVGAADLDCNSPKTSSALLKIKIASIIKEGATLSELCKKCPEFADATEAARLFCLKLAEKGIRGSSWFTGGKGYRIAWPDPNCYFRYLNKTDKKLNPKKIGPRVVSGFMKTYLGEECHKEIQTLCDIDKVTYTPGTGLKTDLFKHKDTKLWPVLIDFMDEDNFMHVKMHREGFDEELGAKIIDYWTSVFGNIPVSWDKCNVLPEVESKPLAIKSAAIKNVPTGTYDVFMPENVVADLKTLLDATETGGCVLKNVYTTNGKKYFRVNCENSGERKCVVKRDEIHTENHAYLMFLKGRVSYWCHANTCNGKEDIGEIPESFMKLTGMEISKMDRMKTYEDKKKEFELTNAKIISPAVYVNLNYDKKYVLWNIQQFYHAHRHLKCKVFENDEWKTTKFVNIWLDDEDIRIFHTVVFQPPPLVSKAGHFNLWLPLKIAEEPLVETERDYWKEYCEFLNNILGDEKNANFVLARIAFRLVNPGFRTHVILILCGIEGDGKNRLLAPIYNIMNEYSCQLSTAKQLYDTHSMYEYKKLFIMVNEAAGPANFENSELLKTRATEPFLQVNPKGVQAYQINNFCDYDMTTNNQNVVKLSDDSQRRFFQIETTSHYLNNVAFFKDYVDNIENNPIALRQIYNGLVNFDYKSIVPSLNFQDPLYKPKTTVEAHVKEQNRDKIILFLEDWVKDKINAKSTNDMKYKNAIFFKMYTVWCENSKVKMGYNNFNFGTKVALLMKKQLNTGGFSCLKKDSSHATTTLYFDELIKYFKNLNGFDFAVPDENDMEGTSSTKRKENDSSSQKHSCDFAFCKICVENKRQKLSDSPKL